MEERQVTSDGQRMPLGGRFLVVATQNPIEYEGTYPLPEAELDRFFLKLEVQVPAPPPRPRCCAALTGVRPHDLAAAGIAAVVDQATLDAARAEVAKITVSEAIVGYIGQIVAATRMSPTSPWGRARGARSRSSSGARRWRRCGAGTSWLRRTSRTSASRRFATG